MDLHLVPEDPVVHGPGHLFLVVGVHGHGKIVDAAAAQAADVVVPPRVPIEAGRIAARVNLVDEASSASRVRLR